jgi:hypothetical protein
MRNTRETLEEFAEILRIDRSGGMIPQRELVDAAALEIASLFEHGGWVSNFRELLEYEYIEDGSVPLKGLLLDLVEYRKHAFQAASWAVYKLLERDLLLGSSILPSFQDFSPDCPDPVLFMSYTTTIDDEAGGEVVILPLIRPGPSLSRWRNLSPGAGPTLSVYERTEESRGTEVQEPASAPAVAYVLEKIDEDTILVRFGEEKGVIRGVGASRIYKLICQHRIHVLELAGDVQALEDRGSAVSFEEMTGSDDEGHAGFGIPGRETVSRESLKQCRDRLAELKRDIEKADSDMEKKELEQERDQILQYVSKAVRSDPTRISKARASVDRDFRRTIKDLKGSMPRFAHHFHVSKEYDKVNDQYVYLPAPPIPWKFKGFQ